jgi:hypothetical protein
MYILTAAYRTIARAKSKTRAAMMSQCAVSGRLQPASVDSAFAPC